jgi:hypothetical protein
LQSRLVVEQRSGNGSAYPCGHQWFGPGTPFKGIRRTLTITQEYANGTVVITQTYANNIVKGLESCEPFDEESDREEGRDYGTFESDEWEYSDPYTPSDILAAADDAIETALSEASWEEIFDVKLTGAVAIFGATQGGVAVPSGVSYHQIQTLGDPGSVSWFAEGRKTEVRFSLKGPRLPCRVDVEFSNGESDSFTLSAAEDEHTLTIPYNGSTDAGDGTSPEWVTIEDIRYYFTPF